MMHDTIALPSFIVSRIARDALKAIGLERSSALKAWTRPWIERSERSWLRKLFKRPVLTSDAIVENVRVSGSFLERQELRCIESLLLVEEALALDLLAAASQTGHVTVTRDQLRSLYELPTFQPTPARTDHIASKRTR